MNTTLLVTGVACLIAAAVGGGLKALGTEFPVLQSVTRQLILSALGLALILGPATARWFAEHHPLNPPSPTTHSYSGNVDLHRDEWVSFHGINILLEHVVNDMDENPRLVDFRGELDGASFSYEYSLREDHSYDVSGKHCKFSITFKDVDWGAQSANAALLAICTE
jgi:hypothetical protein